MEFKLQIDKTLLVLALLSVAATALPASKSINSVADEKRQKYRFSLDKSAPNAIPQEFKYDESEFRGGCNWPDHSIMQEEYKLMIEVNSDITDQGVLYNPMLEKNYTHYIINLESSMLFNSAIKDKQVQCSHSEQKEWNKDNNMGALCDYNFITLDRSETFPFNREVATSDCEYCAGIDLDYGCVCRQFWILKVAFRPGRCQSDGFYELLPRLERIPISYRPFTLGTSY